MKYFAILRVGFLTLFAYKGSVILTCASNLLYVVILYFLWKSIYESIGGSLNGMTFEQAFIYLALTSTMFNTFKTWTEWAFSAKVRSGDILLDLARPISISLQVFCESSARALFNLVWIALPFIGVIAVGFDITVIAEEQIPVALLAVLLAYIISFQIDYITGIATFIPSRSGG